MKLYKWKTIVIIFISAGFLLNQNFEHQSVSSKPNNCYPSNGWLRATPEDLGVNSTDLDRMVQVIIDQNKGIDSIHIVRYGYLCYEKYFEYYNYTNLHNTHSVTKSVISALIGIANSTGMITNLDEPVVEIFSNRTIQNLDARKEAMTIRHLLEMRSGLEVNDLSESYFITPIPFNDFTSRTNTSNIFPGTWINYLNPANDFTRLMNSEDWTQFALDKPMDSEPGTNFAYSDCITHLLSAIIREKTGMNTEQFANMSIFDPLNITDYLWWDDPSGLSMGADGLWLTPNDMLKIGYLYFNLGKWNNLQIIPSDWVLKSIQNHSPEKEGNGYGYQWWIGSSHDFYFADGLGGQHIVVNEDFDLIVVFTAWNAEPLALYNAFILDSIFANVSVTCPTTPITTTSTTIQHTTTTTTATSETTTTTTTGTPGFDILVIFGVVIVGSLFELRKRRK